jgi:hypothetical protein
MTQWEYEVISDTTDWPKIHQYLTEAGKDGWELVAFSLQDDVEHRNGVFDRSTTHVLGGLFHMIFKRPTGVAVQ